MKVTWLLCLFLSTRATGKSAKCVNKDVELLIVQDDSMTLRPLVKEMAASVDQLYSNLVSRFSSAKFGLTAYTDKILPFRGIGNGRGVDPAEGEFDFCYKRMAKLSSDLTDLKTAYTKLDGLRGHGGDSPENTYEGLLFTALDPTIRQDSSLQALKYAAVVVDAVPHLPGEAQQGIWWWSGLTGKPGNPYGPKFLDTAFLDNVKFYPVGFPPILPGTENLYHELVVLHKCKVNIDRNANLSTKQLRQSRFEQNALYREALADLSDVDSNEGLCESNLIAISANTHSEFSLTPEAQQRYDYLMRLLGPKDWDAPLEHPGTFEASEACNKYEYPSLRDVASALKSNDIVPIFAVTTPDETRELTDKCQDIGMDVVSVPPEVRLDCLVQLYKLDLEKMSTEYGLGHYEIVTFDNTPESLIDAISATISNLTEADAVECETDDGNHVVPTTQPSSETTMSTAPPVMTTSSVTEPPPTITAPPVTTMSSVTEPPPTTTAFPVTTTSSITKPPPTTTAPPVTTTSSVTEPPPTITAPPVTTMSSVTEPTTTAPPVTTTSSVTEPAPTTTAFPVTTNPSVTAPLPPVTTNPSVTAPVPATMSSVTKPPPTTDAPWPGLTTTPAITNTHESSSSNTAGESIIIIGPGRGHSNSGTMAGVAVAVSTTGAGGLALLLFLCIRRRRREAIADSNMVETPDHNVLLCEREQSQLLHSVDFV